MRFRFKNNDNFRDFQEIVLDSKKSVIVLMTSLSLPQCHSIFNFAS